MSITTEKNRTDELVTDGVVTDYDFDMHIHDKSEVKVYHQPTGGRYKVLVLDSDYGVVFTEDGGTVSTDGYRAPLAAGKLLIIRHLALTQQTNWLYNDAHTEQTHQDDFDRSAIRDIQQQELIDRCPKFPISSGTKDITFPEIVANMVLAGNSAGDDLTFVSMSAAADGVPEYLNDLLDVTIAAPVANDILSYDGSVWVNTDSPTFDSLTISGSLDAGVITGTSFTTTGDIESTTGWIVAYTGGFIAQSTIGLGSGIQMDDNKIVLFNAADLNQNWVIERIGDNLEIQPGLSNPTGSLNTNVIRAEIVYAGSFESTAASYRALGDSTTQIEVRRTVKDLSATVSGSGSMQAGGEFTESSDLDYKIEIDTAGDIGAAGEVGTATFKWSDDGGATWDATEVAVTTGFIGLNNAIKVWFGSGVGTDFELGDFWTFTAVGTDNQVNTFIADTTNNRITTGNLVVNGDVTPTGTINASAAKIRIRDDADSKPSAKEDGYISVYENGATKRIYTFVGGQRYYADLTADVDVAVGNPIGLLLALTYAT